MQWGCEVRSGDYIYILVCLQPGMLRSHENFCEVFCAESLAAICAMQISSVRKPRECSQPTALPIVRRFRPLVCATPETCCDAVWSV
ncbi:hypothetical protein FY180_02070 [Anaplasma marginale]|nr:hypothetical protein FY180_02070 [Anaplasma marginale]